MKNQRTIRVVLLLFLVTGFLLKDLVAQNEVAKPVAVMAGKKSGTISKDELKKAVKVECRGDAYIVTEFRCMIIKNSSKLEYYSKDENLTPEMLSAFQNVSAGANIYIEFIIAKWEKGEGFRQISPLILTVTD